MVGRRLGFSPRQIDDMYFFEFIALVNDARAENAKNAPPAAKAPGPEDFRMVAEGWARKKAQHAG